MDIIADEYQEKLAVNGTPFPQDADYESSESDRSEEKDSDSSEDVSKFYMHINRYLECF